MSEIKKVTLNELAELDNWKMRCVSHDVYKKINKVLKNTLKIDDYFESDNNNVELYYDSTCDGIACSNDIDFFNNRYCAEVELIEENEENQPKKVNLQYLLDNDRWQLKVTPKQSEVVQFSLYNINVKWEDNNPWIGCNVDSLWISRQGGKIYYDNNFGYESLELEQQTPQNDFDTQQEIFRWLDGGGKITRSDILSPNLYFKDGFIVDSDNETNNWAYFHHNNTGDWKKVTNWYDKLDGTTKNARLCYVKLVSAHGVFVNIYSYEKGVFRDKNGSQWISPTPLTNDEIKAFMVGE